MGGRTTPTSVPNSIVATSRLIHRSVMYIGCHALRISIRATGVGVLTEALTTVENIGTTAQTIINRGTTNTYLSIVVIVGCTENESHQANVCIQNSTRDGVLGVIDAGVAVVRPTAPRATIQISKMVAASPAASKLTHEFAERKCAGQHAQMWAVKS